MAFVGLVICYVSAQFELDADRPVGSALATCFLGTQLWQSMWLDCLWTCSAPCRRPPLAFGRGDWEDLDPQGRQKEK
jgi:hypothetical protein